MNDKPFLSVTECLAQIPVRMSRRALIHHIKAAGPESYHEWRRQVFLTAEQWTYHVSRIRAPGSRLRDAPFKPSGAAPKVVPEQARKQIREMMRKRIEELRSE